MDASDSSRICLELDVAKQQLTGARIGGTAVKIAEGRFCSSDTLALLVF